MAIDKAALARFRRAVEAAHRIRVPKGIFPGLSVSPRAIRSIPSARERCWPKPATATQTADYDAIDVPGAGRRDHLQHVREQPRRSRSSCRRNGGRTSGSRSRCGTWSSARSWRRAAVASTRASPAAAGWATTWTRSRSSTCSPRPAATTAPAGTTRRTCSMLTRREPRAGSGAALSRCSRSAEAVSARGAADHSALHRRRPTG